MRDFRERPIKQKLVIATLATTATALVLAGIGNVAAESVLFREYLRRDLSVLARIIADNSTATLAFNDPDSAGQILAALKARPHIDGACIYRHAGTAEPELFAEYKPSQG